MIAVALLRVAVTGYGASGNISCRNSSGAATLPSTMTAVIGKK